MSSSEPSSAANLSEPPAGRGTGSSIVANTPLVANIRCADHLSAHFGARSVAPRVAGATARAAARLVQVSAAHRIRLGLTGLAAIFLLVMVAAAGMRPSPSAASVGSQAEPLAVLGVAPGAGPAAHSQASPPQARKSAPSRT